MYMNTVLMRQLSWDSLNKKKLRTLIQTRLNESRQYSNLALDDNIIVCVHNRVV